jgi:Fe-S-cluster containining protein
MSVHCLSCGACCASFRVSFYWAETSAHPLGAVPESLTQAVSPHYVCMKGTERSPVRCIALDGVVGEQVSCRIYASRSSTCRDFTAGSDACNRARALHKLPAILLDA